MDSSLPGDGPHGPGDSAEHDDLREMFGVDTAPVILEDPGPAPAPAPAASGPLGAPSVPVSARAGDGSPTGAASLAAGNTTIDSELTAYLVELGELLADIQARKQEASQAGDPQKWSETMLYVAAVKPRVSEMTSRAKRLYVKLYCDAFDRHYQPAVPGAPKGSGTSKATAEIRAKAEAGLAYEASERLERTWRDLQDLTWALKSHGEFLAEQLRHANDPTVRDR